jgi:hypothetical protein
VRRQASTALYDRSAHLRSRDPITAAVGTREIVLDSVPVPILVINNALDKSQCYCFRERFGHEQKREHVSKIRISFRAVGALQRLVVGAWFKHGGSLSQIGRSWRRQSCGTRKSRLSNGPSRESFVLTVRLKPCHPPCLNHVPTNSAAGAVNIVVIRAYRRSWIAQPLGDSSAEEN